MKELFIANDPRFLSGGGPGRTSITYDNDFAPLNENDARVTTDYLVQNHGPTLKSRGIAAALTEAGQAIHSGKAGYHDRPRLNMFLEEDGWPSVGVELETIRRDTAKASRAAMHERLVSNWFHFEDDGSLRSTGDGHECITEPIPSRVYRDERTWIGLQNILVPYVYSWNTSATGLHVHVGLSGFAGGFNAAARAVPDFIRFDPHFCDLRRLARFLMLHVQMNIADEALLSEVFLRPRGGYCARCTMHSEVVSARMTARDVIAMVAHAAAVNYSEALTRCQALDNQLQRHGSTALKCKTYSTSIVYDRPSAASGHGVEMNTDHFATFEFRRGKGTLNGVSVHRMVEYCALVEKYVEKMMAEPDMVPTNHDFRLFLADNTASAALRETALKAIDKKG